MAYRSALIDRVYVVSWQTLAATSAAAVLHEVERCAAHLGAPLTYLALVAETAAPPDADGRDALAELAAGLAARNVAVHVLAPSHAVKRALVASMMEGGARFAMHATLDDALVAVGLAGDLLARRGLDVRDVDLAARRSA